MISLHRSITMTKMRRKQEKKLYGHRAQNLLKTDIKETKEGYELVIDVPGFKKEEVKGGSERWLSDRQCSQRS